MTTTSRRRWWLAIWSLTLVLTVRVQGQEVPPDGAQYSRARIVLPDNSQYEVADLMIEGNQVSFRPTDGTLSAPLQLTDVAQIRVWQGAPAGLWALGGAAGLGLLTAVMVGNANNELEGIGADTVPVAAWALGGAALGGLIGYFVGRTQGTWGELYYNARPTVGMAPPGLESGSAGLNVGLGLRLR